jgi:hypothetical protein
MEVSRQCFHCLIYTCRFIVNQWAIQRKVSYKLMPCPALSIPCIIAMCRYVRVRGRLTDNAIDMSYLVSLGWGETEVHLVRRPVFGTLYQPWMMDVDECGEVDGMIGRGNRSTPRKPAQVPLCPSQITHDMTWDRTRTAHYND